MYLYEMTDEQAATVRKELDSNNTDGIFYTILGSVKEHFYDGDGVWYRFTSEPFSNGLHILGADIDAFEGCIRYKDTWTPYKLRDESGVYFDFYEDICNVQNLIKESVELSKLPETGEPILEIDLNILITTIEYLVEEYLNKKEDTNE